MCGDVIVPAIRIVQKSFPYLEGKKEPTKTEIYVTALPLKILEKCKIDRKTPHNPNGYQRDPDERRINNEMVKYLTGEIGSYPTSVLINIREQGDPIKFEPIEKYNGIELGRLTIPESAELIIIDGQHRIESLKKSRRIISGISDRWAKDIEEYPLPVSILKVDRTLEMVHFYIVNERQKSVPTALAFEILCDMVYKKALPENVAKVVRGVVKPRELWKAKAMAITKLINQDSRSVWRGKLQFVGEKFDKDMHIAKAKTFAESLKYIVKDRTFKDLDDAILSQLLIDYWTAIYELYPGAFHSSARSTLAGYTGLHALHMLFPFVYSTCSAKFGTVSKDTMKKVLSYLKDRTDNHPDSEFRDPIDDSKWDKATTSLIFRSTNSKDVKKLAESLRIKIELAMKAHP